MRRGPRERETAAATPAPPPAEGGTVGLFTSGLWRLRREAATMTGLRPVRRRFTARGLDAVAGWGRKPTAARARALAAAARVPYVALEDGFFRSAAPEDPCALSYVRDRRGVYYDAADPSDLEAFTHARAADPDRAARDAEIVFDAIRRRRLSKYVRFDPLGAWEAAADPDPDRNLLLIDQTAGDAAVSGAGAGRAAFRRMLIAAAREAPGARLLLKTHPATRGGRRAGHFDAALLAEAAAADAAFAEALAEGRVRRIEARARPADLFERVGRVFVVSSLMGFEALVAGRPTTTFGHGFYAGWGLTDDRAEASAALAARRGPAPLAALVAAAYLDYAVYLDPATARPRPIEAALDALAQSAAA